MSKPSPKKLNPAFDAAVRKMLATSPQPKWSVKSRTSKKRAKSAK
jgi:hypothetical protein